MQVTVSGVARYQDRPADILSASGRGCLTAGDLAEAGGQLTREAGRRPARRSRAGAWTILDLLP